MKIAYITAGAGGMFCGSCLHDNTLAAALIARGHDVLLVPTYTPIRTDENDVSLRRVFFGGINVYLQQKLAVFRHTPWVLDRVLDSRGLLRLASRFAVKTQADDVTELTISMLKGEHGRQKKEVAKLVRWLEDEVRPDIVNLTNVLLSAIVENIKARMRVPVICTLQGDDIFLEALPEPVRSEALALIRRHCRIVDGFISTSSYYADFMAAYLEIPRDRIDVVYPGINLNGYARQQAVERNGEVYTIGYFARVCPEKGLHQLAEAFRILAETPGTPPSRLRVSGWLGENNRKYFDDIRAQLQTAGLAERFEYVESPDHRSKVRFLSGLDVLSVPTTYREPKGLYVLEALANGVPVVQPRHGSFPELVEATNGGLLVDPDDPKDLARGLHLLGENRAHREELGLKGREAVHRLFNADAMAANTLAVYQRYV
jgi:glycosyltransferase involved in cell wall biosynthesis